MSTRDESRLTHPLNVGYLVVGLVCLGIAGLWALHAAHVVDTSQVGWLLPLTLVVAGAIGLVALAVRGLTRRSGTGEESYDAYEQAYEQPYEEPYAGAYDVDDHVTGLPPLQASAFSYPTAGEREVAQVAPEVAPESPDSPEETTVLPATDTATDTATDAGGGAEEHTTRIDPDEGGSR